MADDNEKVTEPNHMRRIAGIWLVLSIVADVAFGIWVAPHVPPGRMTQTATSDQFDFNVLFYIALPVMIGVWTYLGYAIVNWSAQRKGVADPVGGEAASGNRSAQIAWITASTVIVLFLAGFGTAALISTDGAGGGQGANPEFEPAGAAQAESAALASKDSWSPGKVLVVQVIAQQWKFTYRYPQFGNFETPDLMLPVGTTVAFNVTSLDVIHDFWAYQLSVKADANPQENNVAFTTVTAKGNFVVRCDELCGIWHGSMFNYGKVVSTSAFQTWASSTESANAANTQDLPPFAWTYVPDANGASGGFYIDGTVTPYSNVEIYGAKQPAS